MPDNSGMISDIEFENQMRELGEDLPALVRFVARQEFTTQKVLFSHAKRIKTLESRKEKFAGAIGGLGAVIGATIASAIDYILRK